MSKTCLGIAIGEGRVSQMCDNLRDRIANVLQSADRRLALVDEMPIGLYYASVADAVIRELKQEWLVDMGYGGLEPFDTREEAINRMAEINEDWGDDPPEAGVLLMSRYVTDWKADE